VLSQAGHLSQKIHSIREGKLNMETTTYRMTLVRRILLIGFAIFFYANGFFLAVWFTNGPDYDFFSTLLAIGVIAVFVILGTLPILMAFRSRLTVNSEGIAYRKFLREKTYSWDEFDGYFNDGNSLLASFRSGEFTNSRLVKEAFFGSRNYIPISNYVKHWQFSTTWSRDPLLRTMNAVMRAREEKVNQNC
jgi:hypothetical protein